MLLEIRQKKPSIADPIAIAPTRARRLVNKTRVRLERLRDHAKAQWVMERRRSLISANELKLKQRLISEHESWTIRQLEHQMERERDRLNLISYVRTPTFRRVSIANSSPTSLTTSRKTSEPISFVRLSSYSSDDSNRRQSTSLSRYSIDSLERVSPIANTEMKGALLNRE